MENNSSSKTFCLPFFLKKPFYLTHSKVNQGNQKRKEEGNNLNFHDIKKALRTPLP